MQQAVGLDAERKQVAGEWLDEGGCCSVALLFIYFIMLTRINNGVNHYTCLIMYACHLFASQLDDCCIHSFLSRLALTPPPLSFHSPFALLSMCWFSFNPCFRFFSFCYFLLSRFQSSNYQNIQYWMLSWISVNPYGSSRASLSYDPVSQLRKPQKTAPIRLSTWQTNDLILCLPACQSACCR